MPPMNLSVRFLGRPIKPVALALTLSLVVIAWAAFTDVGVLDGHLLADFLGGAALVNAALFMYAWWCRSQIWAERALFLASIIWGFRFWLVVFVAERPITTEGLWLSFCWTVVAGGSFLLERLDPTPPPSRL